MTTINDIVNGAIRRVIPDPANTPSPEEAKAGLDALNDMMHAMPERGVHVNWEDVTLTSTFPLEPGDVEGVKALLAKRLFEEYGKPITRQIDIDSRRGWSSLYKQYSILEDRKLEPVLRNFQAQRRAGY